MSKKAAERAMAEAGVTPKDVKVCELHDCFSTNELLLLDALGFSEPGKAHEMVRRGDITYGGRGPVINLLVDSFQRDTPSERLLRGWATNRLVKGTDVALQHNLGLGGAVVVTVYKRADGQSNPALSDAEVRQKSALGYNPAVEARYVRPQDGEKVRSRTRHDHPLKETVGTLAARI
ncbi:non-specific lipid-transfer protein [Aspergillus bombycis]|uniref:Non-specific lipid-transfer protein n=1 Tax=Aspergillus bombycis TaxID=109264 RepID=A0A1F7ZTE1_9EURO|nr:non-specific lipid-transfer protein [Aspergillus bombycis]OGM42345.1 non-specific lipid-transfer protein [Aspergillus bombycis]